MPSTSFMLASFLVLALTGLPQKLIFLNNRYLDALIDAMGGIDGPHHPPRRSDGVDGRDGVPRAPRRLPDLRAARAADDAAGLPGRARRAAGGPLQPRPREERPRIDRYTWEEKVEYWSLIWGTIVMIATGFMLWNPVATARFLPGEFIPAAQVVHGGEALLAILAVLVWHFYSVHLRHFNRSMFTGEMGEHEMQEEHPLELERIQAGEHVTASPEQIARRERVFLPIAGVVALVLLTVLYWFVTFEQTAITTLPPK